MDIPDKWIAVDGSWDVSVEAVEDLLDWSEYNRLLAELQQKDAVARGVLNFVKREKSRVQVSHRAIDSYQLAQENAGYVFRYAKQFCRRSPFILFLAHHPWLGGLSLNTDFANSTSTFTRTLARRSFIQFLDNAESLFGVSKAEASKLISAVAFLNVSQIPTDPDASSGPTLRLFLNPNATNPVPDLTVDFLGLEEPQSVAVERFIYDNY